MRDGFLRDYDRFARHALFTAGGVYGTQCADAATESSLAALIIMEYHRLEKCLVMRDPDSDIPYGRDVVPRLCDALSAYVRRFGKSSVTQAAAATLDAYLAAQGNCLAAPDLKRSRSLTSQLLSPDASGQLHTAGGCLTITYDNASNQRGVDLLTSRHSVRDFLQQAVPRETVREIAENAMTSPSVCNRQEWRLYCIDNRQLIADALALQNGNSGFRHRIPLLFVVAIDLRRFASINERNQGWIDGGIFAMGLLLAIQAKGLGGCPLNWCATQDNDDQLRKLLGIPSHEIVILLVAAGYTPQQFRVAASTRRPVEEIMRFCERAE